MPYAKKIFLSYASEDATWKDNFIAEKNFWRHLGSGVEREDYEDKSNFGPIGAWLETCVESAAAILLFLSKYYVTKHFTRFEFDLALKKAATDRLIIVPIMMDAEAQAWWARKKAEGALKDLGTDDEYAFVGFSEGGKPLEIYNSRFNDVAARRITELAMQIGNALRAAEGSVLEKPDDRVPDPPDADSMSVLLLGHPTAEASKSIKLERQEFHTRLKSSGVYVEAWPDEWSAKDVSEVKTGVLEQGATIVQPLAPMEFIAEAPELQLNRLKNFVGRETPLAKKIDRCSFILWLPPGNKDPVFEKAELPEPLQRSLESGICLTEQLARKFRPQRPEVPVIMLEEMSNGELRENLSREFRKVIEQEVSPPPNEYRFDGDIEDTMLEEQIGFLTGDRLILALHDLNILISRKEEAFAKLDAKLGGYMERVNLAQKRVNRPNLKIFWSALVVRNKKENLPFVRHPSPQFANWHLLPFNTGESTEPDPKRCNIFRTYLHRWVQAA